MLLSGFAMAIQLPKYHAQALSAMAAGLVLFLVTLLNS